jgi:hypothetical protein
MIHQAPLHQHNQSISQQRNNTTISAAVNSQPAVKSSIINVTQKHSPNGAQLRHRLDLLIFYEYIVLSDSLYVFYF